MWDADSTRDPLRTASAPDEPRDTLIARLEATCRALDAELAAAASVQRWLLPPLTAPPPGIRVAASYRTARRSGGDYYDAGALPVGGNGSRQFGIMIADVSGHGAAAAVLMAILRTIVHDEVDRSRIVGPAALLDHADERLCSLGLASRGWFVTAFSASLDTETGALCYSCAGHPPPRLMRGGGARRWSILPLLEAGSLPLGVLDEHPVRREATINLEPGDLIVFYSDGITEARSPAGTFFGVHRVDSALSELPADATPDMAVDAINEAVRGFAGIGAPADDQTLVAVRWRE
jgi:sigma-B regulation protein RsbU (phosphoserine phosphatase)